MIRRLKKMYYYNYGVNQGANLSPTLFQLFINNGDIQIKELHCGIKHMISFYYRILTIICRLTFLTKMVSRH